MSRTYNTTGIILKRRDYQENDRLFCLLTKDYGKIEILGKGTKKIKSKLNPYMEPLYLIKVMIAKGKVIDKLANCNVIKTYSNLRQDSSLCGFYLLNYLAEVTDALIAGQTQNPDKYNLLLQILDILDQQIGILTKDRLIMLANIYGYKLLNLLGYQPEIKRCLICHQGLLLPKNIFDFGQGGIICEKCKKVCLIEDYIIVSDAVIKLMQLATEKDLHEFITLENNPETIRQFNHVVNKLLLVNIGWPLKSAQFLA